MLRSKTLKVLALAATIVTAAVSGHGDARACGGCFHPPTEVTVVSGHRMALSIGTTRTVLWDQIRYSGDPSEFAWVLPVRPGTRIELSRDEFMAALDAWTQPVVTGPAVANQPKGSFFQCQDSIVASYAASDGTSLGSKTVVVSQQTVGPYDVVTLRSTSGDALTQWLGDHMYELPTTIKPVVDAYVKEQFDFIALRLSPGKGVGAMQPVRVVSPGADPTLPLRMVAAGVGARVGILLYVIGEGRYETATFRNALIDDSQLTWDLGAQKSNYDVLASALMTGGDGKGVLTEFAGHAFLEDFPDPNASGFLAPPSSDACFDHGSLASAYTCAIATARDQGTQLGCTAPGPGGNGDAGAAGDADTGDADPGEAGTSDAGAPDASASDSGAPPPIDPCAFDDVDVATEGMAPSDVWVTRLRMELPASALAQDLTLRASASQSLVSPRHQTNAIADDGGCATSGGASTSWIGVFVTAVGASVLARRRRRRA